MRWIAIDEASSAFERPAWAVEKMVQEGKLEKRVDADGRVFVRRPPGIEDLADALAPFLPDEVVPVVAELVSDEGEPAALNAGPSREEMMLRALWKMLEKQQAQIAEIREIAARPPLALPAPPSPPTPPPAPAKAATPVAVLVLAGLLALIGAASFFFTQDSMEKERERAERALDHADMLARELRETRTAAVGTGTLAAGFRR